MTIPPQDAKMRPERRC